MMLVRLWHFETNNPVPDPVGKWFFWQSSPSYRLEGVFTSCMVSSSAECEVYTLGGRECLWRGVLADVPAKYRSYLTEVRVCVPETPPPA